VAHVTRVVVQVALQEATPSGVAFCGYPEISRVSSRVVDHLEPSKVANRHTCLEFVHVRQRALDQAYGRERTTHGDWGMRPIWVLTPSRGFRPRGGMSVMSELSESHRLVTIPKIPIDTARCTRGRLETVEQAVTRSGLAHMVSGLT